MSALIDKDVSVAAINAPDQCVVSGSARAIERLSHVLSCEKIDFQRLHISAAAHSSLVEPVMEPFRRILTRTQLSPPSIPFVSNVTGTWIKSDEASDPEYWVQHLRQTVRFAAGLTEIMNREDTFALEVGPSRTLSSLAASQFREKGHRIQACMRHPHDVGAELQILYTALGKMWAAGVEIDWPQFSSEEKRRRIPLPSYPFQRQRYWIAPASASEIDPPKAPNGEGALARVYSRSWREAPLLPSTQNNASAAVWVLMLDDAFVGEQLCDLLLHENAKVFALIADNHNHYPQACDRRIVAVSEKGLQIALDGVADSLATLNLIHMRSLADGPETVDTDAPHTLGHEALFSFISLCKILEKTRKWKSIRFFAVSNNTMQVTGTDLVVPEKSAFAAAFHVAAQELDNLTTRVIDVSLHGERVQCARRLAGQLFAELQSASSDKVVAYRGLRRWIPSYTVLPQPRTAKPKAHIRAGGVYLITGGTGELGPLVAESFATRQYCKLVVTARSAFPPKEEWDSWLRDHERDERISRTISHFRGIEAKGSVVTVFNADVANESEMTLIVQEIHRRFGALHGVVHLAGVTGVGAIQLIADLTEEECKRQLTPKTDGCEVLDRVLEAEQTDFRLLFSSTASILGGAGLMAYAAANGFIDGFVEARNIASEAKWFSINWDGWLTESSQALITSGSAALVRFALPSEEALQRMHEILAHAQPGQYIVSKGEMQPRINDAAIGGMQARWVASRIKQNPRPSGLIRDYTAPATALERTIASVWSDTLGLEKIGRHDSLFELGGNSLLAIKIASKLSRVLAVDVPVAKVFEFPTVSELAKNLSAPNLVDDCEQGKTRGRLRRETHALPRRAKEPSQVTSD